MWNDGFFQIIVLYDALVFGVAITLYIVKELENRDRK